MASREVQMEKLFQMVKSYKDAKSSLLSCLRPKKFKR